MKKVKIITITIAAILVISVVGLCYVAGYTVFKNTMQLTDPARTETDTAAFLDQMGFDRKGLEQAWDITPVQIPSSGEHSIPADLIAGGDEGTVIMVHGLGLHRAAVYPIAQVFLDMGYDVLAYDQRSAGENPAPYTTYGYLESRDLIDCVKWAGDRQPGDIVLWGVSHGAAAVGICLDDRYVQETVKAVILDSPVSDMRSLVLTAVEQMDTSVPTDFLLTMGNGVTRLRLGFWYEDADIRRHAAQTSVPVLLLTSRADTVAPYYMGDAIYNAIPHTNKRISTVVDSAHGEIYFDDPAGYAATVKEFLTSHF